MIAAGLGAAPKAFILDWYYQPGLKGWGLPRLLEVTLTEIL
jgi:hypothetical protein